MMTEIDNTVKPRGKLIAKDEISAIGGVLKALCSESHLNCSKDQEGILSATQSTTTHPPPQKRFNKMPNNSRFIV